VTPPDGGARWVWRVGARSLTEARVINAVVAAVGLFGLALARWLSPDPAGFGTHEQLGLAPCTFFWLTTIPCPMCGATTAWALMADLRVLDALRTQPFAALLFGIHLAVTSLAIAELMSPRGRWARLASRLEERDVGVSMFFLAALVLGWTYKIALVTQISSPT
jgi:hypothetical protein